MLIFTETIPLLKKTLYQAINILFTEAELFTIRYSINYSTNIPNVSQIIVITDTIHTAEKVLDFIYYYYHIMETEVLFLRQPKQLHRVLELPKQ